MTALISTLFSTDIYENRSDQLRALFIYALVVLIFMITIPIGIVGVSGGGIVSPIIPLTIIITLVAVYGLVRFKQVTIASWLFLITASAVIVANNVVDNSLGSLTMLLNIFLLVVAGFLVETPGTVLIALSSIIQIVYFPLLESPEDGVIDKVPYIVLYIAMGLVISAYNRFIEASRLTGQDIESVERLKLAEVNAQITRQASTRESLEAALDSTLQLILETYPELYHAQVFLIDDDGIQAKLRASTGEAGQKLMAQNHSLAVGSLSVIGQTTFTGEPVIAISDDKDSVHRINELLPYTKLEAAFPLRVEEKIIGALDLQSQVLDELNNNDRLTFQSLANSLSLAIDSIQQFAQAKARINENQRLAEQTRTALREVERLNQRLIGRAWAEYVKGIDDEIGYEVDFATEQSETYDDWTSTLANATATNNLVQEDNIIAVPLRVRGQVVGAMEFELDDSQDFTPEDLELITEVSERFGLAAENTRLVEESQRTAQRETLINQVTSSFQSAQNVETTLAEAARSLSEILHADKVKIRLGLPEQSSNGSNEKDG